MPDRGACVTPRSGLHQIARMESRGHRKNSRGNLRRPLPLPTLPHLALPDAVVRVQRSARRVGLDSGRPSARGGGGVARVLGLEQRLDGAEAVLARAVLGVHLEPRLKVRARWGGWVER